MVFQETGFDDTTRLFEMHCRSKGLAERAQETYVYALGQLRGLLKNLDEPPALFFLPPSYQA